MGKAAKVWIGQYLTVIVLYKAIPQRVKVGQDRNEDKNREQFVSRESEEAASGCGTEARSVFTSSLLRLSALMVAPQPCSTSLLGLQADIYAASSSPPSFVDSIGHAPLHQERKVHPKDREGTAQVTCDNQILEGAGGPSLP